MKIVPTTEEEPIKTKYSATKRLVKGKIMAKKVDKLTMGDTYDNPALPNTPVSKTAKKKAKAKKLRKVKKGGSKKC